MVNPGPSAVDKRPWLPKSIVRATSCCGNGCVNNIPPRALESVRSFFKVLRKEDQDSYLFHAIKMLLDRARSSSGELHTIEWMISGVSVCRQAFRDVFGVGGSRINRLLEHAKKGYTESPHDLRHSRGSSDEPSWERQHADAYFLGCYHNQVWLRPLQRRLSRTWISSMLPCLAST